MCLCLDPVCHLAGYPLRLHNLIFLLFSLYFPLLMFPNARHAIDIAVHPPFNLFYTESSLSPIFFFSLPVSRFSFQISLSFVSFLTPSLLATGPFVSPVHHPMTPLLSPSHRKEFRNAYPHDIYVYTYPYFKKHLYSTTRSGKISKAFISGFIRAKKLFSMMSTTDRAVVTGQRS